ncbi:hypothetical protein [Streptomyces sp. NPDC052127]|uniref:hypothetical protein n=1 Tax=Streptomyces sp. NPDC052127 TaxID=3155679 RepID=UPI00342B51F1
MRAAGNELAVRLTETVRRLDLDNRELPIDHGQDEEEDLARMLIAAAWYQVLARTPIGFAFTPLAKAALEDSRPESGTTRSMPRLRARRRGDSWAAAVLSCFVTRHLEA